MTEDPSREDLASQPLLASQQQQEDQGEEEAPSGGSGGGGSFQRNLGVQDAFAIVISIVIGSGVFTSPGAIDTNVPSPFAALAVWAVGGALAWSGAATMAELGTAIPGEGGVQPYLRYVYGDAAGYLAAWTWVVAVMPATLAILSIVFVESIASAAGVVGEGARLGHKVASVGIMVVVNLANCVSTKASTRLNGFFVVTKFISIVGVVVAGLVVFILQTSDPEREVGGGDWYRRNWFEFRDTVEPDGHRTHWEGLTTWDMLGHYSAALYGALWAYSGWEKAIYVSAELKSPARQLPLAINTSVPTVIICFLATNTAYYILLPWNVVSSTDSVAVTAITRLAGPVAGIFSAALICLVVAGSLLSNSFVASRMAVSAANRNWLPSPFSVLGRFGLRDRDHGSEREEPRSDAPLNALLLSTILSTIYIMLGNFRALLTFNGLGEYSFFFLTVVGAIILRFREPGLRRPYKPFILIPVVFAVVSGFVLVRGAIFAPMLALVLVVVWVLGLLFYYLIAWYRRRR